VGLALWLGSSLFILARGAVVSALLGLAFALSAAFRRPLTRTLAIRLTAEHDHVRSRLAELWEHPAALRVFRVISVGWGLLLLVEAAQQALVVLTFSPGAVVAFEPPLQAVATVLGIVATLLYAKRVHAAHPELALLPSRSPA
jgi:intracellular septation protein A